MSQMIKKMTLLMQLEDGSSQLEPEAFDIAELLGNLMRKNAILLEEKHAQLTLPADRLVFVRADAFLIENVLSNYLSNALHHVRDGGVVSGVIRRAGDERVRISVYNDGACIPPADLPHIWESFLQGGTRRAPALTAVPASACRSSRRSCGLTGCPAASSTARTATGRAWNSISSSSRPGRPPNPSDRRRPV